MNEGESGCLSLRRLSLADRHLLWLLLQHGLQRRGDPRPMFVSLWRRRRRPRSHAKQTPAHDSSSLVLLPPLLPPFPLLHPQIKATSPGKRERGGGTEFAKSQEPIHN